MLSTQTNFTPPEACGELFQLPCPAAMALSRLSNQELRTVHALIHAETIDRMITGAMSSGNAKRKIGAAIDSDANDHASESGNAKSEIGAIDANDHASEATVAEDDADSVVTAAATAMAKSCHSHGGGIFLQPRKKSPPVLPPKSVRPSRPAPVLLPAKTKREKIKRQRESSSSPVLSLMRPPPPPRTWERESMSDDSL